MTPAFDADFSAAAYNDAEKHPDLRLHLSVQASACNAEAAALYVKAFGVRRAVLPRVLSVADIAGLTTAADVETAGFNPSALCPFRCRGRPATSACGAGRNAPCR
jgi:O2-independent ubiquinone biosynthesis protein UbiU